MELFPTKKTKKKKRESCTCLVDRHVLGSSQLQNTNQSCLKYDIVGDLQEMGSELDVTEVMATWTEQMGLPVIDISYDSTNKRFTATPRRFLSNPDADPSLPESPHEYVLKH